MSVAPSSSDFFLPEVNVEVSKVTSGEGDLDSVVKANSKFDLYINKVFLLFLNI